MVPQRVPHGSGTTISKISFTTFYESGDAGTTYHFQPGESGVAEGMRLILHPEIIRRRERYDNCSRARSVRQVPYQVLAHLKARAYFGQWTRAMGPGSE